MKRQLLAVVIGSLYALHAQADPGTQNAQPVYEWQYPVLTSSATKSRAEVLAELAQARLSGDVVVNAETGQKAYELNRSAYPAHVVADGKSRGEVLAELVDAEHRGDLVANAETGTLVKDL